MLFASCFGLLFAFGSCELQEETVSKHNHDQKMKMYYKEFDELITDQKFSTAFSKLPKKKGNVTSAAVGKTIMEDDYGFEFAAKPVLVIDDGKRTSYTFLISRDTIVENVFENLVVDTDSLDNTRALIIKYNIKSELVPANHDSFGFDWTCEFSAIIYNDAESSTSKEWYDQVCTDVNTVTCCVPNTLADLNDCHVATPACLYWAAMNGLDGLFNSSIRVCYDSGGNGTTSSGGTSSGSSHSGGHSGGYGGHSTSINTTPILPELKDDTPCEKIKNAFDNNPTLLNQLDVLDAQTSDTSERGKYKFSNSNTFQTAPVGSNGKVSFPPPPAGTAKIEILAHTHNYPADSTYSIFGWDDLSTMGNLARMDKLSDDFVAFLMTADGTRYAFTIDDMAKFKRFFATYLDSDFNSTIGVARADIMHRYYATDPNPQFVPLIKEDNTDNLADERRFLEVLQKGDMGIALFEVDETFTNFDKVTLEKGGVVKKDPCIN